ncbi:uncharacterized protein LOC126688138 [Mercurialis annua]|uniref:uncharacterized protein LOC126688138 n=1 Tax=Mercurialis annua TaxID=3986 RepID=UPI002160E8C7|nr:uncharacterized protein LOC126688138 [Mercurialis annua]
MEEDEFQRLLNLFPLVRPSNYHIDLDPSKQSTSKPPLNQVKKWEDALEEPPEKGESSNNRREIQTQPGDSSETFWEKLRVAAESKVGAAEAKKFCNAFQQVHKRLVYEELSSDGARRFINSTERSKEQFSS